MNHRICKTKYFHLAGDETTNDYLQKLLTLCISTKLQHDIRVQSIAVSSGSIFSINIQVLSVNSDTIAPGDTTARNHLQYLSDSGTINVPLTTWPITSEEIAGALEQIRPDLLNPANASSYRYLQSIVNAKSTLKLEVYSGTSRDALSAFSSSTREENEARASIDLQNNRTSGTLSISIVDVPLDGKHIRLDGTLVSARLGNDNDSRMLTLGGHHTLTNGHSLNWRATSATINRDGTLAGNLLGHNKIETYLANFEYQFPISENTHFQFAGQFMGKLFGEGRPTRDSGIGSNLNFVF